MSKVRNHKIYRRIFVKHNGLGPWKCSYCDQDILTLGRHSNDGVIHHINEDYTNNDATNLTVMHHKCHRQHHMIGASMSEITKQKISRSLKGRSSPTTGMKFSDAVNKRKGRSGSANGFYGKSHSDELKSKIYRRLTCECGMRTTRQALGRHKKVTNHKLINDDYDQELTDVCPSNGDWSADVGPNWGDVGD